MGTILLTKLKSVYTLMELAQRSPTVLVPGSGSVEGNFSTDGV